MLVSGRVPPEMCFSTKGFDCSGFTRVEDGFSKFGEIGGKPVLGNQPLPNGEGERVGAKTNLNPFVPRKIQMFS